MTYPQALLVTGRTAEDRTPDTMWELHAVWDEHEAMSIVGDFVVENLTDPDAVVLDETG